ncbi:UTP--glucose-1-phosphate uridylyltransferase [Halodesulfovibrio marinisediminis]|uniref:UTP--glucose-1-phosphate uridylyltransferase n=1 Tax=Halodesulfovibrio marinisediminis DSM 17456 TaxID=1121457 RepID=A0A1N6IHL9_9BACT|nr:UTP--glucose-1-phosphate uridylyltransferase [Halodesulfovibrio marinisediminis]SIO31524.1 UTP--glucose-1-phosphate uridylyltransferase [Halodesulfovibrio marinisediminis DSM 17456]
MSTSGSRNTCSNTSVHSQLAPDAPQQQYASESPLNAFVEKMRHEGLPAKVIDLFTSYISDVSEQATGHIPEQDISPVNQSQLKHVNELDQYEKTGKALARKAVAIKLNGGLGTSMGMQFAKSLLPVKDHMSFLDITIKQAITWQEEYGGSLPLVLMNSYNTHKDTLNELRYMNGLSQLPLCFVQHKFPKIQRDTLQPAECPDNQECEWNPPGHGDIYASLYLSGVLDTLIRQGRQYALVSNIDNLGAKLDLRMLGYMAEEQIPFLMEVTARTENDRKGGHLARFKDGRLILREVSQCQECDLDHFQNITRHCLFNTNNIWIDLVALKKNMQQKGLPKLPLILNPKTINPHDSSSTPIYQIETAMGAAISHFKNAQAIITTRDRFIPVKRTDDLLKVMSDYYLLDHSGTLKMNEANITQDLQVHLDPRYYSKFDNIYEKFKEGVPSLSSCTKLGISGDIIFNPSVSLKGDVTINNQTGNILLLPDDIALEGLVEIK